MASYPFIYLSTRQRVCLSKAWCGAAAAVEQLPKYPSAQQPMRPTTAPEARLLARGCTMTREESPRRLGAEERRWRRCGACPRSPSSSPLDIPARGGGCRRRAARAARGRGRAVRRARDAGPAGRRGGAARLGCMLEWASRRRHSSVAPAASDGHAWVLGCFPHARREPEALRSA